MPPPIGSRWLGWPPGLRPPETLLAEAAGILVAAGALTLALTLAVGRTLALAGASSMLWCCACAQQVRGGRAAVYVPSLRAVRRKEDSVLDSCCSLSYVRFPAGCGAPTFANRAAWPCAHIPARKIGASAVGIVFEIESVTSVWRPEPTARGTPAREVRRLEDVPIVPSFAVETQAAKAVNSLITLFRQPGNNHTG